MNYPGKEVLGEVKEECKTGRTGPDPGLKESKTLKRTGRNFSLGMAEDREQGRAEKVGHVPNMFRIISLSPGVGWSLLGRLPLSLGQSVQKEGLI